MENDLLQEALREGLPFLVIGGMLYVLLFAEKLYTWGKGGFVMTEDLKFFLLFMVGMPTFLITITAVFAFVVIGITWIL